MFFSYGSTIRTITPSGSFCSHFSLVWFYLLKMPVIKNLTPSIVFTCAFGRFNLKSISLVRITHLIRDEKLYYWHNWAIFYTIIRRKKKLRRQEKLRIELFRVEFQSMCIHVYPYCHVHLMATPPLSSVHCRIENTWYLKESRTINLLAWARRALDMT